MNSYLPIICGISGTELSNEEIKFFEQYKPWGVILFERNCSDINSIKRLTAHLKEINHIKAHGALYNEMINDSDIADFYLDTIKDYKERCSLYVPYQSEIEMLALKRGFKIIYEVFADRNYNDDLSLVSRDKDYALINTPKEVIKERKEFRKALFIRNNYTEMLNILQANIMNKLNNKKYKKLDKKFLDDALMTSIAGISAAMKNTG